MCVFAYVFVCVWVCVCGVCVCMFLYACACVCAAVSVCLYAIYVCRYACLRLYMRMSVKAYKGSLRFQFLLKKIRFFPAGDDPRWKSSLLALWLWWIQYFNQAVLQPIACYFHAKSRRYLRSG